MWLGSLNKLSFCILSKHALLISELQYSICAIAW